MSLRFWRSVRTPILVVLVVGLSLLLFVIQPYRAPSSSMSPTLRVGDRILVNKYHYGIRLPLLNKKIIQINDPQRGDVMVFRFPPNPRIDYVKRVIGLPGDEISYRGQQLYINGEKVEAQHLPDFYDEETLKYYQQFSEKLGTVNHHILVDPRRQLMLPQNGSFPYRDNCRYSAEGVTCKVPEGHYFMMGDNRDNSQDSRYWGFVPDENIVGKVFFRWDFGDPKRVGSFQ